MMKSVKPSERILFLLASAALLCGVVAGQVAGDETAASPAKKLVTVNGPDVPIRVIFSKIAAQAGVRIDVASSVSGSMDVSLTSMELEKALDLVCASAGLAWRKSEGGKVYTVTSKAPAAIPAPPVRPAAEPAAAPPKSDEAAPAEKPKKGLTPAQIQLVLRGVPQKKAADLLGQWRRGGPVASPRVYTPGGIAPNIGWRPSVVMTPYGPYYPAPPNVTYYLPDGSVYTGHPYPAPHTDVP